MDHQAQPSLQLSASRGFTLVELLITLALFSILLKLAVPSFVQWTRNAQVRTVTDSLQSGLRLAQAEAVRRNRQTVFFLTNSAGCDNTITANANGAYWAIRTAALVAGEAVETVQCGNLSDVASGVGLGGPTVVCFSSMGRQVANAAPGVGGAACTLDATGTSNYNVTTSGSDRPLRVQVSLGGQVRMCDPARAQSSSMDGCP